MQERNVLRDSIILAIGDALFAEDQKWSGLIETELLADAVMEVITVHIPPILASAIRAYADSQIAAMDYHGGGDGSAIEELRQLSREAAKIALYATTHERWKPGGKPA